MFESLAPVPDEIKHPKSVSPGKREMFLYLAQEKIHNLFRSKTSRTALAGLAALPLAFEAQHAIVEMVQPSTVEAAPLEQNIILSRPWMGTERNWRPLSYATAARHPGTSPLHEVGGPLHSYDIAHEKFFGWATDARAWEEAEAARWLGRYPGREIDAGYCRELAILSDEPNPNDFLVPELATIPNIRQSLRDIKVGLLIAMHASDPKLRFGQDAESIGQILRAFPSNRVIVESPDNWFRPVYGLSSDSFLGTNFRAGDIWYGRGTIVSAQVPYYINYYYGTPLNGSARMQAESRTTAHINEHLNHNFIRYLVSGEQYADQTP